MPLSLSELNENWPVINRGRGKLIDKKISGTITDDEQIILDALQAYADWFVDKTTPRPAPKGMKQLNLTELQELITDNAAFIPTDEQAMLHVIKIVEAAKRRDEQEKRIGAFPVSDEGLPEYMAMVNENIKLTDALSKLLEDVDVGDE